MRPPQQTTAASWQEQPPVVVRDSELARWGNAAIKVWRHKTEVGGRNGTGHGVVTAWEALPKRFFFYCIDICFALGTDKSGHTHTDRKHNTWICVATHQNIYGTRVVYCHFF